VNAESFNEIYRRVRNVAIDEIINAKTPIGRGDRSAATAAKAEDYRTNTIITFDQRISDTSTPI